MNTDSTARRALPYLVAIVSFLAVCMVYFAPMLEGRTLQMHDVTQFEGMQADIQAHRAAYGEDPQWEGRLFSGMPAYLINVKYDSMVVRGAMGWVDNLASPASLIFLAMVCFWCMCLLCGISPWVGIVPSLAYGLSTYLILIVGAGHITKLVAMAYAPLMLGGLFYTFRTNMWRGAAMTALFAAIQIAANHPQITYYFVLVMLAFWINELVLAIREKWLHRFAKITGLLFLAGVLAVGANFIGLYNIQKHSKYTTRGGSELTDKEVNDSGLSLRYATAWSYGVGETLNLFVPNLMGGSSFGGFSKDGPVAQALAKYNARDQAAFWPAYWGDQPMTGGPTYLGAAALLLAVAGLFLLRGRYKWWIVAVSGVAVALAWGSNMMWFTRLFFNWFPGYDKFRTVAMILVIVQWAVPMLAAMFLWSVWREGTSSKDVIRAVRNAVYVLGGLALALILFGGALFDFASPQDGQLPADVASALRTERASMMRGDAFRSLVYVLLTAAAVWLWAKGTLKRGWALLLLAGLVTADLAGVDSRFLPWKNFVEKRQTAIRPTEADKLIMADTTPGFRVANLTVDTFNDATTSYFHRSIGGYHGAKLQRYQDVIDRYLTTDNREVYNMLNTRWVIWSEGHGAPPEAELNPDANGAAWFVQDVAFTTIENNADQELDALSRIDTKTTAVIDRRFKAQVGSTVPEHNLVGPDGELIPPPAIHAVDVVVNDLKPAPDTIYMTQYRVNRQIYKYNAAEPRLAVFSEIYYPEGWTATVDGQPLDYFRADYILRAATLPAGEHEVVFSFAVPHFRVLSAITVASTVLILLLLAAAILIPKFCCKRHGTEEQ